MFRGSQPILLTLLTVGILIISNVESNIDASTYPIEDLFYNHYPLILRELRPSQIEKDDRNGKEGRKWKEGFIQEKEGYIRILRKRSVQRFASNARNEQDL